MSISGGSAGSLIGAVVGGIIGSIVPGVGTALGASIGAFVGGLAGTLYDTATADDIFIDQPKLSDINLQTSEFGQAIPQVWRRYRLAGNIIDLGDKLEFEDRTYEKPPGSKGGGPRQIVITRTYELSYIAFGICDTLLTGPMAGVARIWEDATVIYDIDQDNELPEGWVFYPGTADQDPDPTIEAEHGVGQTNAHRYLCYMVAAPLPIGPTGRVANYTFEVYQEGAEPAVIATLAISPVTGHIWALVSTVESLWRISAVSSTIIARVELIDAPRKVNIGYPVEVDSGGFIWVANGLHYTIQRIDPSDNSIDTEIAITHSIASEIGFSGGDGWVAAHHFTNNTSVVYRFDSGGLVATITRNTGSSATLAVGADGHIWVANWGVGSANTLQRINPATNTVTATISLAAGGNVFAMTVGTDGHIWLTESGTQQRVRRVDPASNTIVANVTVGANPAALTVASDGYVWVGCNGNSSVYRINPADNSAVQHSIDSPVFSSAPARRNRGLVPGSSGAIWAASVSANVVTHITTAGVRTPIGTAEEPVAILPDGTGGIWVACGKGGDIAHVVAPSTYTPLASRTGLRDILADICGAVGIPGGNLDTTLVPSTQPYLALVNVAAARVPIETLMEAYQLFVVESGTKLKFGRIGSGSVVATIGTDEWGASDRLGSNSQGTGMQIHRVPEHLLPTGLAVVHVDPERSFQNNTQRAFIGEGRSNAENVRVLSLAVGILPGEAKARAQEGLDALWIRRTTVRGSLSQQYGYLEPGDRIQTSYGLVTYDLHIIRTNYGRPGILEVDAVGDVANVVGVLGSAAGRGPSVTQNQAYAAPTEVLLWNLPALTATDTAPRYHVAYASSALSWPGCQLHRSLDGGTTYAAIDQTLTRGITGTITGTVASPAQALILDESTTITVVLQSGSLASVTDLELYNGANLCVIGNEVVAFGVATLTATRTYQLTRLLRGRRGTEWAVAGHVASERFTLIDIGMRQLSMTLGDRSVARQYKCVGTGDTLANTAAVSRTPTAENLVMWTPAYLEDSFDEVGTQDWAFTWYHRSRWAGEWIDNNGIGFDSDLVRYELYVYEDNTYTTRLRTITVAKGSDPEAQLSATYTNAQQVADFGLVQLGLHLGLLQYGNYGPGREYQFAVGTNLALEWAEACEPSVGALVDLLWTEDADYTPPTLTDLQYTETCES